MSKSFDEWYPVHLAVQLQRRFLIIVDKEFLMNQWKSEIENFMEGARVGILQANKAQIEADKYDITICMIQTICRRDFPDGFFDQYGFTIFDECHHLGASYFCQALKKIQTKAMLGLSATPDRDDGLTCVFEAFLGDPVYKNTQRAPDKEAVVKAIKSDEYRKNHSKKMIEWWKKRKEQQINNTIGCQLLFRVYMALSRNQGFRVRGRVIVQFGAMKRLSCNNDIELCTPRQHP